jgi:thymidylate kinase
VELGYNAIAKAEPERVKIIDATQSIDAAAAEIWRHALPMIDSLASVTRR